jgi:hypothetical protein
MGDVVGRIGPFAGSKGRETPETGFFGSGGGDGGGGDMTNFPTREEMNAKLEAVESRIDTKLGSIIDGLAAANGEINGLSKIFSAKIDALHVIVSHIKSDASAGKWAVFAIFLALIVNIIVTAAK